MFGYLGAHAIYTPDLESRLKEMDLRLPDNSVGGFGLGLKLGKRRTFGGFDGSIVLSANAGRNRSNAWLYQLYLNHKIIDNRDIVIAPGIDLGNQTMQIQFKRQNASNNFDSLFLSSGNYVRISNTTAIAGASVILHLKKLDTAHWLLRAFSTLRVGYKQGLSDSKWKSDNTTLVNAPSDKLNSFYFQVLIGFW